MNNNLGRIWKAYVVGYFKVLYRHFPGDIEKIREIYQDTSIPNRDFNPEPPMYEAG
jgi:hypothetical protein